MTDSHSYELLQFEFYTDTIIDGNYSRSFKTKHNTFVIARGDIRWNSQWANGPNGPNGQRHTITSEAVREGSRCCLLTHGSCRYMVTFEEVEQKLHELDVIVPLEIQKWLEFLKHVRMIIPRELADICGDYDYFSPNRRRLLPQDDTDDLLKYDEYDITTVMTQVICTRWTAIDALKKYGNLVDAILGLIP